MARGRRLRGWAGQCCSIALLVILVAGAFRQPARHPRTSPKGLRRCSAAQDTRTQAGSPVQLLINSSTSSSSVTARSQGHLHRHAAAHRSRRPCISWLPAETDGGAGFGYCWFSRDDMAMEGAESLGVSWSLCLANHATRKVSCLKATTTHISAFQQVLHASTSWSGTRMDWFDGMGSVRSC